MRAITAPAAARLATSTSRSTSSLTLDWSGDGDDIVSELIVNVAEAALGVSVEVETVDGPEAVEVPSGMQPGVVVTLRGKGVPHYRSGRRGDHHIRVRVVVPGKLSREQRSLIEHLREVLPPGAEEDPRSLAEKVRAAFR